MVPPRRLVQTGAAGRGQWRGVLVSGERADAELRGGLRVDIEGEEARRWTVRER